MAAWMYPAAGAAAGLASSLFTGGRQKTEQRPDQFTRNFRSAVFGMPQPWEIASGRYPDALNNVWRLPEQTYGPTPDFRVYQPPTPQVAAFYQGLMNRAQGSPYERAAGQYAGGAVGGQYLQSNPAMPALGGMAYGGATNPWLDQMVTRAQRQTGRNVASMFGRSGMGGSSLEQGVATRELGNVATDMYGRAYDADMTRRLQAAQSLGQLYGQERGLQQEAAFNAPMLANMDFNTLMRGLAAAEGMSGYGTRMRQEDLQAHQFGQQAPYNRLGFITGAFQGMPSGQTTRYSRPYTNPLTSALGGAFVGQGLYRMLPGGVAPGAPAPYQTGATPDYGYGPMPPNFGWS